VNKTPKTSKLVTEQSQSGFNCRGKVTVNDLVDVNAYLLEKGDLI
jgi:hypothetical protein